MFLYVWSLPKLGQPRISNARMEELMNIVMHPLFQRGISALPKTAKTFYQSVDNQLPGFPHEAVKVQQKKTVRTKRATRTSVAQFTTISKPLTIPYHNITTILLLWLSDPKIMNYMRFGVGKLSSPSDPVQEFNQTPLLANLHRLHQCHTFEFDGKEWNTGDCIRWGQSSTQFGQLGGVIYKRNRDPLLPPTIHLKLRRLEPRGARGNELVMSREFTDFPLNILQLDCEKIPIADSAAAAGRHDYWISVSRGASSSPSSPSSSSSSSSYSPSCSCSSSSSSSSSVDQLMPYQAMDLDFTLPQIRSGGLLMLPQIYLDGFTNSQSKNDSHTGVYMSLANFDKRFRHQAGAIATVMIIPSGVAVHEALAPLRSQLKSLLPKDRIIDIGVPSGLTTDPEAGGGFRALVAGDTPHLNKMRFGGSHGGFLVTAECPLLNFDGVGLQDAVRGPSNGSKRCCCSCWAVDKHATQQEFCPSGSPGVLQLDTSSNLSDVFERKTAPQMRILLEHLAEIESKNQQLAKTMKQRLGIRTTTPRPYFDNSTIGLWMNLRDPDHIWWNIWKALVEYAWAEMKGPQRRRWRSRMFALRPASGMKIPTQLISSNKSGQVNESVNTYGSQVSMSHHRVLQLVGTMTLDGLLPPKLYKHWCSLWSLFCKMFRSIPAQIPAIQESARALMREGKKICKPAWTTPNSHTFLCFINWTLPKLVNLSFARTSRFEKHHQACKKQNSKLHSSWKTKLWDSARRLCTRSVFNGVQWGSGTDRRYAGSEVQRLINEKNPLLCALATPDDLLSGDREWIVVKATESITTLDFVQLRTKMILEEDSKLDEQKVGVGVVPGGREVAWCW